MIGQSTPQMPQMPPGDLSVDYGPVRKEALREMLAQGHVKLVSDGTTRGTFVLMPDGTAMPGVHRIEFEAEAGGLEPPEIRVTFRGAEVQIAGGS